jgi:hypothetical protein
MRVEDTKVSNLDDVEYEVEYHGRKVRRTSDGKQWLIVPARGGADAGLGDADTHVQFATLEAARDYLDEAVEAE